MKTDSIIYRHKKDDKSKWLHVYFEPQDSTPLPSIKVLSEGVLFTIEITPYEAFGLYKAIQKKLQHVLSCATMTDQQIEERVRCEVEHRLAEYEKTQRDNGNFSSTIAAIGLLAYGDVRSSKDTQILNGLKELMAHRELCRKQLREIGAEVAKEPLEEAK